MHPAMNSYSCGLNDIQRGKGNLCKRQDCQRCSVYRPAPPNGLTLMPGEMWRPTVEQAAQAFGVPVASVLSKPAPAASPVSPLMAEVEAKRAKHEERRYQLAARVAEASILAGGVANGPAAENAVKFADALLAALQLPPDKL